MGERWPRGVPSCSIDPEKRKDWQIWTLGKSPELKLFHGSERVIPSQEDQLFGMEWLHGPADQAVNTAPGTQTTPNWCNYWTVGMNNHPNSFLRRCREEMSPTTWKLRPYASRMLSERSELDKAGVSSRLVPTSDPSTVVPPFLVPGTLPGLVIIFTAASAYFSALPSERLQGLQGRDRACALFVWKKWMLEKNMPENHLWPPPSVHEGNSSTVAAASPSPWQVLSGPDTGSILCWAWKGEAVACHSPCQKTLCYAF